MSNTESKPRRGLGLSFTAKMAVLAAVAMLGLGTMAWLGISRMSKLAGEYDHLIASEETAQQLGMETQVEFRQQVQEWKNILLRGSNPEKLAKHTGGFDEHQKNALAKCDELEKALQAVGDKEALGKTTEFRDAMDKMDKTYRAALAHFVASGGTDIAGTDKLVEGLDKAPTQVLKDANTRVDGLIQDRFKELRKLTRDTRELLTWAALGILLTTTILITIFIVLGIRSTLNMVAAAVSRMGAGDFTVELKEPSVMDETGRTIESVIVMQRSTRELIKSVNNAAQQVAQASDYLQRNAEETASATGVVAEAIQHVATDADATGRSVDHAQQNLEQNYQALDGVSRDIEAIARYASEAAQQGEAGRQQTTAATEKIKAAAGSVMRTAEIVRALGERTAEIDQFSGIITGIADQTNLLALNAAIEAARAGDAGRGFAVVAEEVRKLAEESSQAASSITQRIKGIQSEMVSAEEAMARSNEEVSAGANMVDDAARLLEGIVSGVQQLDMKVQNISAAVEELNASSSEIVNTMETVSVSAKSNVDRSGDVSSAAQQQLANMESIGQSTRDLSQLSQGLLLTVQRFAV